MQPLQVSQLNSPVALCSCHVSTDQRIGRDKSVELATYKMDMSSDTSFGCFPDWKGFRNDIEARSSFLFELQATVTHLRQLLMSFIMLEIPKTLYLDFILSGIIYLAFGHLFFRKGVVQRCRTFHNICLRQTPPKWFYLISKTSWWLFFPGRWSLVVEYLMPSYIMSSELRR